MLHVASTKFMSTYIHFFIVPRRLCALGTAHCIGTFCGCEDLDEAGGAASDESAGGGATGVEFYQLPNSVSKVFSLIVSASDWANFTL